ncbi:MAG: inorganic pyrophosphatase [Thermoanaerobaculia bacterium]|jgi:inorganic pyrophosphatase|nr:inorganic pyrophosphatase [Thermoanaerobaculia bacterium]MBP9823425.1 inorganic pyrophosphatase [Thermoanaerobaculia bacterium]
MATNLRFREFRPHPWHGLPVGPDPPRIVTAYIEIGPLDTVKYEIDKVSGYLKVDRPQRGAAQPPTLYGFIPRTYCGSRMAALSPAAERGDGDPLDICVVSERTVTRADILLDARVVGGLRMIDRGEADDKIIAVLKNDLYWGDVEDLDGLPPKMVERLAHYFTTYKQMPGETNVVSVAATYGREHAEQVVLASMADYIAAFGSH